MNRHIIISQDNPRCPVCSEHVSQAMLQCTVRVTIPVELSPDLSTIESRGTERIQGAEYFYVCFNCGHPLTANSEEMLAIFQATREHATHPPTGVERPTPTEDAPEEPMVINEAPTHEGLLRWVAPWGYERMPAAIYGTTTTHINYNVVEGAADGGTMDIRQGNRREQ